MKNLPSRTLPISMSTKAEYLAVALYDGLRIHENGELRCNSVVCQECIFNQYTDRSICNIDEVFTNQLVPEHIIENAKETYPEHFI